MRIFKYFSSNTAEKCEFARNLFSKGELYFSSINKFNDPFEFSFQLYDQTKIKRWGSKELAVLSILLPNIYNYGVACFSRSHDNILMWSHYADGHSGICVEFESDECPILNCVRKVDYSENCPVYSITQ